MPTSGPISIRDYNNANGFSSSATSSMNDSAFRRIAGKSSGSVSLYDTYGKYATFFVNIGSPGANSFNVNLRDLYVQAGGPTSVVAYVQFNVLGNIGSNSADLPALTTGSGWPSGSTLILNVPPVNTSDNNPSVGVIAGAGGKGGLEYRFFLFNREEKEITNPGNGGTAINLEYNLNVINQGVIGGGGGGGLSFYHRVCERRSIFLLKCKLASLLGYANDRTKFGLEGLPSLVSGAGIISESASIPIPRETTIMTSTPGSYLAGATITDGGSRFVHAGDLGSPGCKYDFAKTDPNGFVSSGGVAIKTNGYSVSVNGTGSVRGAIT